LERVLEALGFHFARGADALGVAGGAALLGEECLGVGLGAQRVGLPGECAVVVAGGGSHPRDAEVNGVDEPVTGYIPATICDRHSTSFRPNSRTGACRDCLITPL